MWRNETTGGLLLWLMDGVNRIASVFLAGPAGADWRVVGTGRFNGDASPDILFRDATTGNLMVRLMGLGVPQDVVLTPAQPGDANWKPQGVGDFDADRQDDILFRNDASGALVAWLMDGTVRRTGVFLTPSALADPNWRLSSLLDLDADGRVDLLWQHQVSGRLVAWLMHDTKRVCGTYLSPDAPEDPAWRIAGPR